jgi:hypothetical protein
MPFCSTCGKRLPLHTNACPTCAVGSNPRKTTLFSLPAMQAIFTIFLAAIVVLIIYFGEKQERHVQLQEPPPSQPQPAVPQPTLLTNTAPSNAPEESFRPLELKTSGRLPAGVQHVRLGMTIRELSDVAPPSKEYYDAAQRTVGPQDSDYVGKAGQFELLAGLTRGRLVFAYFTLGNLSEGDAAAFDQDTLSQLGPPDKHIRMPAGNTRWVWMDGDLRLAYSNRSYFVDNGRRYVRLEVSNYPVFLKIISSISHMELPEADELQREWGDVGDTVKTLPTVWRGLQFGMAPWQIRSVFPGAEIHLDDGHGMSLIHPGPEDSLTLWFQEGRLTGVCDEVNLSSAAFQRNLPDMMAAYGTPVEYIALGGSPPSQHIEWQDGERSVLYTFLPGSDSGGSSLSRCLFPLHRNTGERSTSTQEESSSPPTVAEPKSFF